jgi:hypothetical protein
VTVNALYHGRSAEFVFQLKGKKPTPVQIKNRPPQTDNVLVPWRTYNANHPPISSAEKTTPNAGANSCTFSSDPNGNTINARHYSFHDALWIKRYNGIDNGDYIYWKDSNLSPGESLGINYKEANTAGGRYVELVCGTPEP